MLVLVPEPNPIPVLDLVIVIGAFAIRICSIAIDATFTNIHMFTMCSVFSIPYSVEESLFYFYLSYF